jgi:hypothetical protein
MKALPIFKKGVFYFVWSLLYCIRSRRKEVMGWLYFADVASMTFSEKKLIAACDLVFWGYGVRKSNCELQYDFDFCPIRE